MNWTDAKVAELRGMAVDKMSLAYAAEYFDVSREAVRHAARSHGIGFNAEIAERETAAWRKRCDAMLPGMRDAIRAEVLRIVA